jgi:hypothetical protein
MKICSITGLSRPAWNGMTRLLAMLCLVCSWSAQATAPRIAPQLFGEEEKADIVGYQFAPQAAEARHDSALTVEIVTEAFKAAGKVPKVDVLPARQLALYALRNNDAVALMGRPQDLTTKERSQYRVVTFYLRTIAPGEEPVSLIFSVKDARKKELLQAFDEGLQKILKSGKYLEILEKYLGKGKVPTDYARRLKRHNPGWK